MGFVLTTCHPPVRPMKRTTGGELLPFEGRHWNTDPAPLRPAPAPSMIARVPSIAPTAPDAVFFLSDIEAALSFWRARAPSPDGIHLAPEVAALAEVYARMAHARQSTLPEADMPAAARTAWLAWYDSTPDTPCIAICSTSQGDAWCKGCGRSFEEVQHWLAYGPLHKRAVWQRITRQGSALRFTRYAERAAEGRPG